MRCTTRTIVVLALGWVAVGAADASAAWDNVFQTSSCCQQTRSSFFAPAPSPCCPSVSYVQRSYYQSVTTYKQESYLEPVTTYRKSYYWDPVTSYRYTSYYDPCTGCCNAVQSYVQRCRMVPVTEMRKSYYLEPVVTYYDPCGNPIAPAGVADGVRPPAGIGESTQPGAAIGESSEPPRIKSPGIQESTPRKVTPTPTTVRPDRIASRTNIGGRLQGQVVRDDRITPRGNATLKFVAENSGEEVIAKADLVGRFAVDLPAGEWTLYAPGAEGTSVFHSTVQVRQADDRRVTVVSR
jgi:hypothetical protein